MNTENLILFTDSYKAAHWQQYPPNTATVFSYIEPRGCSYTDEVVAFGLQYFLKKYLSKPITMEDINEAEMFLTAHGVPFNKSGWIYILEKHDGFLPVRIKSIPEGTVVKIKNVMLTIENTDPECYWLTSYLETALLQNFWYGCTVASNARYCKKLIKEALEESSDNPEVELPFKLHCFGFRGVSSLESAGLGNMAFLTPFQGADTIQGALFAMKYYDAQMPSFSIPASEHSTMTSWTKNHERDAYQNMVTQYAKPGKIFACVIDSYNIWAALDMWCDGLLDQVKEAGATVVLRPDSSDPTKIPIEVIEYLMNKIGYKINSKGFKVLPDHVRVIQGDGISIETIPTIIDNLLKNNLSMTNLAFGMGAGTLQKVSRDDFRWAMKCSSITTTDGKEIDVFKDPITDPGKQSKKGRIGLYRNMSGVYLTLEEKYFETTFINQLYENRCKKDVKDVNIADLGYCRLSHIPVLETVFENGKILKEYTFDEVRQNSEK